MGLEMTILHEVNQIQEDSTAGSHSYILVRVRERQTRGKERTYACMCASYRFRCYAYIN